MRWKDEEWGKRWEGGSQVVEKKGKVIWNVGRGRKGRMGKRW